MSADGVVQGVAETGTQAVDAAETPPIAEVEFVCQARVPGGVCGARGGTRRIRRTCACGAISSSAVSSG